MKQLNIDRKYMKMALRLARKAWGMTSPNPMVGAVLVKNGRVAGKGFHKKAGTPHAEINAISNAGAAAVGSVLYVTLEPCSTFGRTPPCTDAIIKAGISKVVIGSLDPNPLHAGAAVKILQDAGIEVVCNVEEDSCRKLNEAFFKWIVYKKPFVLLKLAMTLDGKIATAEGRSKWITGTEARSHVQKLRRWADAIMVGGRTVLLDNPSLTVREPEKWPRQPRRIICSRTLSVGSLKELMPAGEAPELFSPENDGDWEKYLLKLGSENVTSLLIEGGGELASSALNARIVDKIEFHYAPKILGGKNSCPAVGGPSPLSIDDAFGVSDISIEKAGQDIILSGYIKKDSDK